MKGEFDCKFTGKNEMHPDFLDQLQTIRSVIGEPMIITSGYRDPSHPVEARKSKRGEHTYGLAADIKGDRLFLLKLITIAYKYDIRRIGVNFTQGYVHLGIGDRIYPEKFPRVPWDYAKKH